MVTAPGIPTGLRKDEDVAMRRLIDQWSQKRQKNALLSVYYDGHRAFKDLGISIPPQLANTRAVLEWPAKAVRALAQKHVFEGFVLDGQSDPFGIDELLEKNRFGLDLGQGIHSAYKHSCAFITTTKGDTSAGEPEVVVQFREAVWTTALWDKRRREMSAFLAIVDTDDLSDPTSMVLMLPGRVVTMEKGAGRWSVDRRDGVPGRILAEMLTYDPQIGRPFGRSRISREVRYLTDAAVRTLVRTETSAEFFASPQRYALGVDAEAFADKGRWTALIGRMLALEVGEDGEKPDVGQFPQISMEPHLSMYRQLAQNFCASTGLPMSSVGLFTDNPASAEAMQAAEHALADEAEYQWRVFAPALVRTAQNIVMLRDGLREPPAEAWRIRVNKKAAKYVSPQAAADFTVKAVSAIPKIAETTEALRGLGFSEEQIDGMQSEWRRSAGPGALQQLLGASRSPSLAVEASRRPVEDVPGDVAG